MDSLERVKKILKGEETDRIAVYPMVNSISRKYMDIDYEEWSRNPDSCARSILRATDRLDLDIICTQTDLSVEAADWGMEINYDKNRPAEPTGTRRICTMEEYDRILPVHPRKTLRMSATLHMAELFAQEKGKEKYILGYMFSPLGILSMLRGLGDLIYDMFEAPEKVHQALENISISLEEMAVELLKQGCHGIMINTIYASEYIMSPQLWEKFSGDYLERICGKIHDMGGDVFLQSTMHDSFFQLQIDKLNPQAIAFLTLPGDCHSMRKMKETYGKQTALMGHVDPEFLSICTEEQLRQMCRRQIEAYRDGGGFILSTGYEYPMNLNDYGARIMVEEAKTFGQY